jgi:lipoyl-dependent peroxiredoxin
MNNVRSALDVRACASVSIGWQRSGGSQDGYLGGDELSTANHVACYAMALSHALTQAGTPPERLDVSAASSPDRLRSDLTTIYLEVRGQVPGLDQAGFELAASQADQASPIWNALLGRRWPGAVDVQIKAILVEPVGKQLSAPLAQVPFNEAPTLLPGAITRQDFERYRASRGIPPPPLGRGAPPASVALTRPVVASETAQTPSRALRLPMPPIPPRQPPRRAGLPRSIATALANIRASRGPGPKPAGLPGLVATVVPPPIPSRPQRRRPPLSGVARVARLPTQLLLVLGIYLLLLAPLLALARSAGGSPAASPDLPAVVTAAPPAATPVTDLAILLARGPTLPILTPVAGPSPTPAPAWATAPNAEKP